MFLCFSHLSVLPRWFLCEMGAQKSGLSRNDQQRRKSWGKKKAKMNGSAHKHPHDAKLEANHDRAMVGPGPQMTANGMREDRERLVFHKATRPETAHQGYNVGQNGKSKGSKSSVDDSGDVRQPSC